MKKEFSLKKLASLFLLAVIFAASVFAIDGVGTFTVKTTVEANSVNSENDEQAIVFTPALLFTRDLTKNLNLIIGLNSEESVTGGDQDFVFYFDDDRDTVVKFKRVDERISYRLGMVPGNMSIWLRHRNHFYIKPEPSQDTDGEFRAGISYSSPIGPGRITAGVYTGIAYAPKFDYNQLGFSLNYTFNFGLGFITDTSFYLGEDIDFDYKITSWQVMYSIPNAKVIVGVEGGFLHRPATSRAAEDLWVPIKPFIQYSGLADGLALGVYTKFNWLLRDNADIMVSPGIYANYTF
jgi:hypothetical protein